MKELQNFKLTDRLGTGIKPALAYLEKTLQALQFVDFGDIPIASFLDQNLAMDDYGNCTVTVNTLEQEVEIKGTGPQSVYLRNNAGILQYSNDHNTWANVGSGGGGSGDMTKAVYDPQATGRVLLAEGVSDGTHAATAEQVAALVNAEPVTLPAVLELPSQTTDPATPTTLSLLFYAKEYQQGPMHWMQPTLKSSGGDVVTIATMDEQTGRILSDHLPEDTMYAGTYINNDTPANATAVTKANHVANNGFLLSGDMLLDLAKGLKSIGVDGNSAYYVADGVAIMMQNPEPAASAHAAIVYLWMESTDPVVYALRVVFPDGTRRRMVTEAIV